MPRSILLWSAAVIGIGGILAFNSPDRPTDLPGQFDSPVMAMYMAVSLDEVHRLVSSADTNLKGVWNRFLVIDCFFALAYAGMFLSLAKLARPRKALAAAAIITALADLAENAAIFSALRDSASLAAWVKPLSLMKWTMLGATALLASRVFSTKLPLDTEAKLFCRATSFFYLVTAVITAFGLWQHYILERVVPALAVSVLLHAYIALDGKRQMCNYS